MEIKKILVANRSEIAVRILRAAREMDIRTVAVYSEVDRFLPHVRMADEAYCLGDPDPSKSYLNINKIISIAKKCKADAIHPGYGFLSENFRFAKEVISQGLVFIGPEPENIRLMGDKLISKEMATKAGVPVIPGTNKSIKNLEEVFKKAEELGYPVLIKASAGGGGKGMRICYQKNELKDNIALAKSEAKNAFGSGEVFLEKYIEQPRHIEVQVLADYHGNVLHLYERDCSIQRRHQKLVEESPSPAVDDNLREKLTKSAIAITSACAYRGAGTVEFMVDRDSNYYFLEMNTRLQVEHPVTELITGIDLVKEQIGIAMGNKISRKQEDIRQKGHVIELRVYAEDPYNDFLPANGILEVYKTPKGPGIRVDDGYEEKLEVPVFYDALIAKLLAYGENRETALRILDRAIDEYQVGPIPTTLSFGKKLCNDALFRKGIYTTGYIDQKFKSKLKVKLDAGEARIVAALACMQYFNNQSIAENEDFQMGEDKNKQKSLWKQKRQ